MQTQCHTDPKIYDLLERIKPIDSLQLLKIKEPFHNTIIYRISVNAKREVLNV